MKKRQGTPSLHTYIPTLSSGHAHQNYVITMYLKAIEVVHPYTQNTAAALRPGVSALAIIVVCSKIRTLFELVGPSLYIYVPLDRKSERFSI